MAPRSTTAPRHADEVREERAVIFSLSMLSGSNGSA
jgi:hypothetical protein